MWQQLLAVLLLLVASATHTQSRSLKTPPAGVPEQLPGELWELLDQCSAICKNASRHCLNPPRRCGHCLDGFVERDGLCFHKYNPADEVDTWRQAMALANDGVANKPSSGSRGEENLLAASASVGREQEEEEEAGFDDSLLAEDEDEAFEREDDRVAAEMDDKGGDGDEEEEESEDETAVQLIDAKETRSSDTQKVAKVEKQEAASNDDPGKQHDGKAKDRIVIHEMPTPASMVQLAVNRDYKNPLSEFYTLAIVIGCAVVSIFVLVGAGLCYYRHKQNAKATSDVEYPAFSPGVPVGVPREQRAGSGDRKLAQSAQMYHYQHQKQQMIAAERASDELNKDEESEEENDEGDYTVYECPGLAPTGEMEVKNPLFADESTVTAATADSPTKKD